MPKAVLYAEQLLKSYSAIFKVLVNLFNVNPYKSYYILSNDFFSL